MLKKVNFKNCLSVMMTVLILSSCAKDDGKLPDRLIINGTSTTFQKAYISDLGMATDANDVEGRHYIFQLTTESLAIDEDDELVGVGNLMTIHIFSFSKESLASGTYTAILGSFSSGQSSSTIFINYDSDSHAYDALYSSISGRVKVSKSGSSYKISFNYTMNNGPTDDNVIKGSFEGEVILIE